MLYIIQSTHLTWLCGRRTLALDVVLSMVSESQDSESLGSSEACVIDVNKISRLSVIECLPKFC